MRKILLIMLLAFLLIFSGCNSNDDEPAAEGETGAVNEEATENDEENMDDEEETVEDEEEASEEDTEAIEEAGEFETQVGETVQNEGGSFTLINRASDIPTQEDGPIILNISQVNTAYAELEGEMIDFLERETMHYIQIDMEVENTSSETIEFYASQAIITTNTGEQLEADFWLSDYIEGTYIGEVKKSGTQFFILENSEAEDVEWVRIVMSSPVDDDWDSLGEGIDFRVEF